LEVAVFLFLSVHAIRFVVLHTKVVHRRDRESWSGSRHRTDGERGVKGGLLGNPVEEVGKCLRRDDRGIAEELKLLCDGLENTRSMCTALITALIVRIDRFTIAVCISCIGAI